MLDLDDLESDEDLFTYTYGEQVLITLGVALTLTAGAVMAAAVAYVWLCR